MTIDLVRTERADGNVEVITLNRPDRLNAVTSELCTGLHENLERVAADRTCRAVVLTGAGRAFCAGLDLQGFGAAPGSTGTDKVRDDSQSRSTCPG